MLKNLFAEFSISLWCLAAWMQIVAGQPKPLCPNSGPSKNGSQELRFFEEPRNNRTVCDLGYVELYCCTEGYEDITWWKTQKEGDVWKKARIDTRDYMLENGQVYVIETALSVNDERNWKCVAKNRTNSIESIMFLDVLDCSEWHEPPKFVLPDRNSTEYRWAGMNINITCKGYFGPLVRYDKMPNNEPHLYWTKNLLSKNGTELNEKEILKNSRVTIDFSSDDYNLLSVLTIVNITNSDFADYNCHISDDPSATYTRKVTLKEGDPQGRTFTHEKRTMKIATSIALIFCVSVLCFIVYHQTKLVVKLFIKDRWYRPLKPDGVFDALVVYHNESIDDDRFVQEELRPTLEDIHKYRLAIHDLNFDIGAFEITNYDKMVESSQCILFLLSPAFFQNEHCTYILQRSVDIQYRNMIFLYYAPIPDAVTNTFNSRVKTALSIAKHKIHWNREISGRSIFSKCSKESPEKFWYELRYALPPKLSNLEDNEYTQILHNDHSTAFEFESDRSSLFI